MIFNTIIYKHGNKGDKWITTNQIVNKDKHNFGYQGCVAIGEMSMMLYSQCPKNFEKEFSEMVGKNIIQILLGHDSFEYRKTNINEYLTLSKLLKNSKIKLNKKTNTIIYCNKI